MELSAELFADILDAAPAGVQPPWGTHERRRAARPVMRFQTRIICRAEGAPPRMVQTTIRDFSQRGVGLTHASPMRRGQQFVLMLPGRHGSLSLLYTVAHVEQRVGQAYYIGAEFVCVLKPTHTAQQIDELERIRKSILT